MSRTLKNQRAIITKVRALVSKRLAVPPRFNSEAALADRTEKKYSEKTADNLWLLYCALCEPTEHAFIYAMYWLILKRPPDPTGKQSAVRAILARDWPRARLMLRYMLSKEARSKVENKLLPVPLFGFLVLGGINFFLFIPIISSLLRTVALIFLLRGKLAAHEADLWVLQDCVSNDIIEYKDDLIEEKAAQIRREQTQ